MYSFCVVGHAQYAKNGQDDIVCAGASAITLTLAGVIYDMADYDTIAVIDQKLDPGNTVISASVAEGATERFEERTRFFETGFSVLSQEYPKHIRYAGTKP